MLDLVDRREPGLITRFGGHAMAAGLTLKSEHLSRFDELFQAVLHDQVDPACFDPTVITDGELRPGEASLDLLAQIESEVWGQGFPEPVFTGRFDIRSAYRRRATPQTGPEHPGWRATGDFFRSINTAAGTGPPDLSAQSQ